MRRSCGRSILATYRRLAQSSLPRPGRSLRLAKRWLRLALVLRPQTSPPRRRCCGTVIYTSRTRFRRTLARRTAVFCTGSCTVGSRTTQTLSIGFVARAIILVIRRWPVRWRRISASPETRFWPSAWFPVPNGIRSNLSMLWSRPFTRANMSTLFKIFNASNLNH